MLSVPLSRSPNAFSSTAPICSAQSSPGPRLHQCSALSTRQCARTPLSASQPTHISAPVGRQGRRQQHPTCDQHPHHRQLARPAGCRQHGQGGKEEGIVALLRDCAVVEIICSSLAAQRRGKGMETSRRIPCQAPVEVVAAGTNSLPRRQDRRLPGR